MRKYLPYIALLVSLILAFSCKRSEFRRDGTPRQAAIVMDSMSADFGTFPKSAGVQRTVFTFKNEGDADLEFQVVDPSCGCVKVEYPQTPVKPGKKGEIVAFFNGKYKKPGKVYYKIYVECSGEPDHFVLRLGGYMTEK